jgi:hypothetical protein
MNTWGCSKVEPQAAVKAPGADFTAYPTQSTALAVVAGAQWGKFFRNSSSEGRASSRIATMPWQCGCNRSRLSPPAWEGEHSNTKMLPFTHRLRAREREMLLMRRSDSSRRCCTGPSWVVVTVKEKSLVSEGRPARTSFARRLRSRPWIQLQNGHHDRPHRCPGPQK